MSRFIARLRALGNLIFSGKGVSQEIKSIPASFVPPNIEPLTKIDAAEIHYETTPVLIHGIVSPSNQGGWPGQNDGYQIHCFSFAAWKIVNAPIVNRELIVIRPVPPNANYFDDFPELTLPCLSVFLSTDHTRAVFENALPTDSTDDELLAIASELRKPVVVTTEQFGDFILDRRIGWFSGHAEWNGTRVRMQFLPDENKSIEASIRTAEALWADSLAWKQRIDAYAAEKLLKTKNEYWLSDGEPELSENDFISRMKLVDIGVSSGGRFEFWHDDGEMFCGHSIQIRGDIVNGPSDADIPG